MTLAEITSLITSNIDTTGRRLTTGIKMREVLNAIVAYLSGGVQVKTVTIILAPSQVYALHTTAIGFGITAPAGFYQQPLSCNIKKVYNSVPFSSAFSQIVISEDATLTTWIMESDGGPIDGSSNSFTQMTQRSGTQEIMFADGSDVYIGATSAIINGDSDVSLLLTYVTLPTPA